MGVERALTFVGGGSAKFWEVRQDGAELHIRYGRLGAAGQAQVKSFGSDAAATTAAEKLVAEKLRKGYTETTSSPQVAKSPVVAGSAEDENRLTFPPAWLRVLHPRRGGAKVSVPPPDASAPAKLAAELDNRRKVLADTVAKCRERELAAGAEAYLAGEPDSTPLGAAVVAMAVAGLLPWNESAILDLFADTWLIERGPVFAAVAVTELASLNHVYDEDAWVVRRLDDGEVPDHWSPTGQIDAGSAPCWPSRPTPRTPRSSRRWR
ncbi:WGR domain-containing protein [Nonomuraea fuscirosea]|uniref:WGR domain-containing protein n=1 Tax=Nonomuraea fuscirosea TaxID=1291556 RepID=A0A2T0M5I3_9ACTN|nr:WGR domain-containing protein [Nonomuraea fuscirosea]PRX52633.1 WGR domain-containing protein [Nonomuraea fuscirosea]